MCDTRTEVSRQAVFRVHGCAGHRVTDGKFCGNARPQFRGLVALGNCTVGIVDSLGPLTEGFYDTAFNEASDV